MPIVGLTASDFQALASAITHITVASIEHTFDGTKKLNMQGSVFAPRGIGAEETREKGQM